MNTIIELSSLDRMVAGIVGLTRNSSGWENRMKLEPWRKDFGYETHIIGAMCEYAVARFFGVNWEPVSGKTDTNRGDVGSLQIRSITSRSLKLIVKLENPENFRYILCLFNPLRVELLGWIHGAEAKQPHYWVEKSPDNKIKESAYFVPINKLRPMQTLTL